MQQADGFLSYTRTDDQYFGGCITDFRKMLQNAVHVVTGEKTFHVFQDIEGIVIGEQWKKKLTEVIQASSFFIPMLSPLFFNSKACRDEVTQFVEHERTLGRDDLILPVYFVASPKLEKQEEKEKDPIAMEISARQIFDWRENADLSLQEAKVRRAMLTLAGEVADRLQRFEIGPAHAAERDLRHREYEGLAADPRVVAGVADAKREELKPRTILWVDDNPNNNIWERRALDVYGLRFLVARDTDEADDFLSKHGPVAAIISDMGRPGDSHAGLTLLERVRHADVSTPFFIYTSPRAAREWSLEELPGATGITADPDVLIRMVIAAVR